MKSYHHPVHIFLLFVVVFLFVSYTTSAGDSSQPENEFGEILPLSAEREFAVVLEPGLDPESIAHTIDLCYGGRVGGLSDVYKFKPCSPLDAHEHNAAATALAASPGVVGVHIQTARQHTHRRAASFFGPHDPLYYKQWHLSDEAGKQSKKHSVVDINVVPVWASGVDGGNITIAVVDDGLDWRHPDFIEKYVPEASWDFNGGDDDPSPTQWDTHGTAAAGVAAGASNAVCGLGVAPGASIAGVRLIAAPCTDIEEAEALATPGADVYSASWGPPDTGKRFSGPQYVTRRVLENGVRTGRGGTGSIYVWASGNGAAAGDSCAYDGYVSSRFTIAVGAHDSTGIAPSYSEGCAALLVSAPSSGGGHGTRRHISTSGLMDKATRKAKCNELFGGTSAAAPIVAGVVALMLSVNPTLHWLQVQDILVKTSRPIDTTHRSWITNGAGKRYSPVYGFGAVDADAAVSTSLRLVNNSALPLENVFESPWIGPAITLRAPVGEHTTLPYTISAVSASSKNMHITSVDVEVTISGMATGGTISLALKSPAGTRVELIPLENVLVADPPPGWKFSSVATWGEVPFGTWTLEATITPHTHTPAWAYAPILHTWRLSVHTCSFFSTSK